MAWAFLQSEEIYLSIDLQYETHNCFFSECIKKVSFGKKGEKKKSNKAAGRGVFVSGLSYRI